MRIPGHRQGGFTMVGLIFWAILLAMGGLLAVKVLPVYTEYMSIRKAVQSIKDSGASTVADVRRGFEKQTQVEYGIQSITAQDLEVSVNGSDVRISYAYDREVPLFGPVLLLFRFSGSSR
ncbi:DUF4845 domain-containing protein [Ideonella livida]|uniref:DUF4845 domain-containing protein n=1 Tax=Ideonella livida TaxID=2707176 RepID=A0A7C9TKA9_9BURK|nr:DUF4845 domain-containing protein [Ideonella livida]NDY91604.1 DUF4845 domain-containing protein [Ideonella livida]